MLAGLYETGIRVKSDRRKRRTEELDWSEFEQLSESQTLAARAMDKAAMLGQLYWRWPTLVQFVERWEVGGPSKNCLSFQCKSLETAADSRDIILGARLPQWCDSTSS